MQLYIHIIPDKTNNTLSIIDSGIGMTKVGKPVCLSVVGGFWAVAKSPPSHSGDDMAKSGCGGRHEASGCCRWRACHCAGAPAAPH